MSDARTAVLAFLEDFWRWRRPLADDADLFDVLEIEGDDAFEFMDAFVARFDVEAGDYRWYFHHGEEGWSIGALFFRPVHQRFGRIPITVAVLTEAVRTRRWPIAYPEHVLPGRRWDIVINQTFGVVFLGGVIAWAGWALWARFFG